MADQGNSSPSDDQVPSAPSDEPNVRVVEELRPEEVRWFFKKSVSEKLWQPLNGKDSLAMEMAYRRHQALQKTKQHCDNAPIVRDAENWAHTAVALGGLYVLTYEPDDATPSTSTATKEDGAVQSPPSADVPVLADAADADTPPDPRLQRFPYRLKPLYWEGNSIHLARGTWFLEASGGNWQPLDGSSPNLVERIEAQHLKVFADQPIPERATSPKEAQVLCEVKDAEEERKPGHGFLVRWRSVEDVVLFNHSHSSRLWRYLKPSPSGTKLMRGYRTEAQLDDGPPPVTDLLFVIHGIGQKRTRNKIVSHVAKLREISEQLLRTHFGDTAGRPMFLAVDWRTELQLDEHVIQDLTPNYLEQIRAFFNESLMDLMYYASPVHGLKITRSLSTVLNRMYRTFVSHDPGFLARNGRICLVAHSLGAVIAYDILAAGDRAASLAPLNDNRILVVPRIQPGTLRLQFPISHMFCMGSPLGVFLAARHTRGARILRPPGTASGFRLHNIYHPADAVAYRIEPLVSEIYAGVRPLRVHKFDSRDQVPYESLPNEVLIRQRGVSSTSKTSGSASASQKGEKPQKQEEATSQPTADAKTSSSSEEKKSAKSEDSKENVETIDIPPGEALPYRVDYALRPGRMMSAYWTAITSHESYWSNRDIMMYILSALYGVPQSSNGSSSPKNKKT